MLASKLKLTSPEHGCGLQEQRKSGRRYFLHPRDQDTSGPDFGCSATQTNTASALVEFADKPLRRHATKGLFEQSGYFPPVEFRGVQEHTQPIPEGAR